MVCSGGRRRVEAPVVLVVQRSVKVPEHFCQFALRFDVLRHVRERVPPDPPAPPSFQASLAQECVVSQGRNVRLGSGLAMALSGRHRVTLQATACWPVPNECRQWSKAAPQQRTQCSMAVAALNQGATRMHGSDLMLALRPVRRIAWATIAQAAQAGLREWNCVGFEPDHDGLVAVAGLSIDESRRQGPRHVAGHAREALNSA